MISVYRITFADGFAYVGQTRRRVKLRIWLHRTKGKKGCRSHNPELWDRFFSLDYEVEVLSRHRSQARADDAEIRAIRREARTLNKSHIKPGQETPPAVADKVERRYDYTWPRKEGDYKCRICREVKPSTEFHTDRRRCTGIASKCKRCANQLRHRLKTRGKVAGRAVYRRFVAEKLAEAKAAGRA